MTAVNFTLCLQDGLTNHRKPAVTSGE